VQEKGRYTEESIAAICNEELRSGSCEFFSEALSLASSHSDFKADAFCQDMDRAQFCANVMDKLLQSTAVSDLAFGECERAKPQKSEEYCRKIKQMLGYSVQNNDLDTIRACYMIEAYTNLSTANEVEASEQSPESRIIAGSNAELNSAGKGKGPGHPPKEKESNVGRSDIVLQPQPLENFGKGKGSVNPPPPIIAGAIPAPAAAAPVVATAPAPAPVGSIIVKPVTAPAEQSQLQKSSSKISASAEPVKVPSATAPQAAVAVAPTLAHEAEQPLVPPQVQQQVSAVSVQAPVQPHTPATSGQSAVSAEVALVPLPPKPHAGLLTVKPSQVVPMANTSSSPKEQVVASKVPPQPASAKTSPTETVASHSNSPALAKPAAMPAAKPVKQATVATSKVATAAPQVVAKTPAAQPVAQSQPVKVPSAKSAPTPPQVVKPAAPPQAQKASKLAAPQQAKAVASKQATQSPAAVGKASSSTGKGGQPAQEAASAGNLRTANHHPVAGLTEKSAKVKQEKKKSDYSGFLSGFVA